MINTKSLNNIKRKNPSLKKPNCVYFFRQVVCICVVTCCLNRKSENDFRKAEFKDFKIPSVQQWVVEDWMLVCSTRESDSQIHFSYVVTRKKEGEKGMGEKKKGKC